MITTIKNIISSFFYVLFSLTFILLISSKICRAEIFSRYGIGVYNSAKYNRAEVKVISLGYQKDSKILLYQIEGGYWSDSIISDNRKGSFFGNLSSGIRVTPNSFYVESLWGISLISTLDSMLGGHFQFNQDLGLGVLDKKGKSIGVNYKHMSSAGLYRPNLGRDFFTIKVVIPW